VRWKNKVPQGRPKFQPSLRDLSFSLMYPGIEMPGYFQMFLWNRLKLETPQK
jgi:hypothetical protein